MDPRSIPREAKNTNQLKTPRRPQWEDRLMGEIRLTISYSLAKSHTFQGFKSQVEFFVHQPYMSFCVFFLCFFFRRTILSKLAWYAWMPWGASKAPPTRSPLLGSLGRRPKIQWKKRAAKRRALGHLSPGKFLGEETLLFNGTMFVEAGGWKATILGWMIGWFICDVFFTIHPVAQVSWKIMKRTF